MAFRSWPPSSPVPVDPPDSPEGVLRRLLADQDAVWAKRGVLEQHRRAAALNAENWTRAKVAEYLRTLDPLLPEGTLRALEPGLMRELGKQGVAGAEKWLAGVLEWPKVP